MDRPARILHVDDDPDFTELTATVLEREAEGVTVETAASGAEGIDRLSETPFDCIVSDYDMPGMDGIEFLEAVRETRPEIPFILFTGKGSEEVASDAISAGVTDYLQKETGIDQYAVLANRIHNAVEHDRAEQARTRQLEAIETAQEGISILDDDGEFVFVNERYAALYGYDPDELVGEHWELLYPDDEIEFAREEILDTVAEAGIWTGESTGLRADGTTFPEDHAVTETDNGDLICTVTDLTERRERESELERLTTAVDKAPIGITIADPDRPDNPLVAVNERFQELSGYDRDEILGRNCRFLQGEDTDPDRVAKLRTAIEEGEPVQVELRNYRKDGTEFWNRVTVTPVEDDRGRVRNLLGFQEDVTERKGYQRELERGRDRFSAIFEVTPDPVAHVRFEEGRSIVHHVNSAFEETFGVDPERIEGRSINDAIVPAEYREEARSIDADVQSEGVVEREVERLAADGRRTFRFRSRRLELPDGTAETVGVYTDVTDRKDRERQLKKQKAQIEALHGVAMDIETCETPAAVYDRVVSAAEEILNFDIAIVDTVEDDVLVPTAVSSELTAENYYEETPVDASDNFAARAFRTGTGSLVDDLQAHDVAPASSEFRSVLTAPIGDYGVFQTTDRSVGAFDETDRDLVEILLMHAENQLRRLETRGQLRERTRELEHQNDRLSDFASIVSHDLRNPLNVAQGHIELARDDPDESHLDEAATAIERSLSLVDDLLALAREGEQVDELRPTDLAGVVGSCWDLVETGDATLRVETERTIDADPERTKQLIENLVANAVEHGGTDVTVTVGDLPDGFYLEDDGSGIPEEVRERAFEAGYSATAGGTGLGLYIVREIVAAHDWTVTITDGESGGARFEITDVSVVDT